MDVRQKMLKKAAVAAVLIFSSSCKNPFSSDYPSLKELLAAPAEITVAGRVLTLETYLWRNLMPGVGPEDRPLLAIIRVTAADGQPFPPTIDADRLWIIYEGDIWETELSETTDGSPHQLSKIARNGPQWGPNAYVTVVVRIIPITGGSQSLLRASHQFIGAAY